MNSTRHTCLKCGYVWQHGKHGGHSCSDYLLARLQLIAAALNVPPREQHVDVTAFTGVMLEKIAKLRAPRAVIKAAPSLNQTAMSKGDKNMGDHTFERHTNCEKPHCPICDGGLSVCTVCGGVEGSLTSECPGHRVLALTSDVVYAGDLDFRGGKWVAGASSIHSPTGIRRWIEAGRPLKDGKPDVLGATDAPGDY